MGTVGFSLINPEAAVLVLGGTIVASGLAHGWGNLWTAFRELRGLARAPLDEATNRAALARLVYAINRQGRFAAQAPLPPDPALADVIAAYLRLGDVTAMKKQWRTQRIASGAAHRAAAATWRRAGELAPVAGLATTLYAIAGLAPKGDETLVATTVTAVATAVVSTLYGLLLAHLICLPLAGAIERKGQADQAVRTKLMRWFQNQLPPACPKDPRQSPTRLVHAA